MKRIIFLMALLCPYVKNYAQDKTEDHYAIGMSYLNGINLSYDLGKAKEHLMLAAQYADPRAMLQLAAIYEKNADSAVYWYNKAIAAKAANAHFLLGRYYQLGTGIKQNFSKAASYYKQGVQVGEKYARNALAYLYFKGLGVSQDYAAAFQLFLVSARDSLPNSMYFLGVCYRNGYGVPSDQSKAHYWLGRAAAEGENAAIHELMEEKTPENKSVISLEWEEKLKALRLTTEKYKADNDNNYEGNYEGSVVYFDWSGKYVTEIQPLELHLTKTAGCYNGLWKEGESKAASITMSASNNKFVFAEGASYVRKDHYSARKEEVWQFNNASFELTFLNDSVQLMGSVKFYSPVRKEPGKPLQVILRRKLDFTHKAEKQEVNMTLFPNPAQAYTSLKFSLANTATVAVQVYSQAGTLLYSELPRVIPAGTYTTDLPTKKIKPGTYIVKLLVDQTVFSKLLMKL
ncbi:T9SS type A sorting domain-containing protein [Filimonas effusa]|uniref:T9SS type A sorting domain-containing protein n=1 Tax=Filimonas effusa TaxID=2508721 RepID=A0A4Q1D9J4_9BACT|nr:T9SS type A sorting domain-containing protein [Filimonas effusa]RXK86054.1 T9SS type A sorting domain-containing protein [Filimonas effusa]